MIEFALLLTQVAETAEVLDGHEVVPPLLSAAEDALARLDWPTATAAYVARVAPGREAQRIWQLPPGLDAAPPGLDDGQRAVGVGARPNSSASGCAACATAIRRAARSR